MYTPFFVFAGDQLENRMLVRVKYSKPSQLAKTVESLIKSSAMRGIWRKYGISIRIILAAVLVVTQIGIVTHALEHHPATQHDHFCSICVVAHSAASACLDTTPVFEAGSTGSTLFHEVSSEFTPIRPALARQRAPPLL